MSGVLPIHHFMDLLVLEFGIEMFDHTGIRLGLSFIVPCVHSTALNSFNYRENSIEKTTATNKIVKKNACLKPVS